MKISGKAYPNLFRTISLLKNSDEIQDGDGNLDRMSLNKPLKPMPKKVGLG